MLFLDSRNEDAFDWGVGDNGSFGVIASSLVDYSLLYVCRSLQAWTCGKGSQLLRSIWVEFKSYFQSSGSFDSYCYFLDGFIEVILLLILQPNKKCAL